MNPPNLISFEDVDSQSIRLFWMPADNAISYDIQVEGIKRIINTKNLEILLNGLLYGNDIDILIRSVGDDGIVSDWYRYTIRTTKGVPDNSLVESSPISPITGYNNELYIDLEDANGNTAPSLIRLWWQVRDGGWWADLEYPVNTPVVRGRKMGLNCGLLDGLEGIMSGNIVLRSKTIGDTNEPNHDCFKLSTHELRWEPYK